MREAKEKTIRGRTFKVLPLPGMKGTKLFYRLSGAIIPALMRLGKGLEVFDDLKGLMKSDVEELVALLPGMGEAASLLFEKLPEDEFERLIRTMLDGALVKPMNGDPEQPLLPIFDDEMAGDVPSVLQLLGFALEVNFGNFMPGLVAQARGLATAKAKSESGSKGSTTSPGQLGVS